MHLLPAWLMTQETTRLPRARRGTDKASFPLSECACLALLQVHLLNAEHNPDVMLLAARAITFLADVLPSSCSSIVRHGAVPAFCARLLTIEYIDLAEQSLQVIICSLTTLVPRSSFMSSTHNCSTCKRLLCAPSLDGLAAVVFTLHSV